MFIPILKRQPAYIKPVGSLMFWYLSHQLTEEAIPSKERRSEVTNFYRHIWISDELYAPTVVMNSEHADLVSNEALTYVVWSNPESFYTDSLSLEDAAKLIKAGREGSSVGGKVRQKLFARRLGTTH